jgi:hypothetical protein
MDNLKSRSYSNRKRVCDELGLDTLSPRAVKTLLRLECKSKQDLVRDLLNGRVERSMNVGIGTLNELRGAAGLPLLDATSLRSKIISAWREAAELLSEVKNHPRKKDIAEFLKKSDNLYVLVQNTKSRQD